ncbi:MAG: hypothetical protein PHD04_00560 [Candidatus Pacebacteria bacterium]|nr:hypothetical protein [Candidatus Paceibacterota bacterium]
MGISIEYLAKLGRQRTISPLFERAWMRSGGSNPVRTAMQIVENKRRNRNRSFLGFAMMLLVLLVLLGFVVWGVVTDKEGMGNWFVHLPQAVFLAMASMVILGALEGKAEEVDDATISHAVDFCEHLDLARSWTSASFELLLPDTDDEAIRQIGTSILVDCAAEVLRLEEGVRSAKSPEHRERMQILAGNSKAEFTRRYNTLHRIGLASGGYDKYFEIAQHAIDVHSKKSPEAATA